LSNPHVHLALTGPANREQLKQNFAALEMGPLTEEEMERVREYGRQVKAKKKLDYV
jgi:aryl-alcohol dehydrogenase-like predicted oxidoreductase